MNKKINKRWRSVSQETSRSLFDLSDRRMPWNLIHFGALAWVNPVFPAITWNIEYGHLIGWILEKACQALAFSHKQHYLRMAFSVTNVIIHDDPTKCSLLREENALDQSDRSLQTRIPGPKHWV